MKWMDYLKYYHGGSITKSYEMGNKIGMGKFSVVYHGK
jgi:RIO-like serine/threonine protein kinase